MPVATATPIPAPRKMFKGFATNDTRVIKQQINHLETISSKNTSLYKSRTSIENQLSKPIKRVMTITDLEDSKLLADLRSQAIEIAMSYDADLLLFEASAASYLISPYPEEDRESWVRILDESDLMLFGRASVARQLSDIKSKGVNTGAVLPTTHGFKHLAM